MPRAKRRAISLEMQDMHACVRGRQRFFWGKQFVEPKVNINSASKFDGQRERILYLFFRVFPRGDDIHVIPP